MSQKVRDIGIVALGIINGVNAIYQLLFRQDIVLFIVSAIVVGLAFYTWVNRDNPEQLNKMNRGWAVFLLGMVATIAFILIMNDFFGFEQWESWQKSVVRFTFVFGLVTLVNRYFKKNRLTEVLYGTFTCFIFFKNFNENHPAVSILA